MDNLKSSPSALRNREPILKVLELYLNESTGNLLEIGSGTGEHAVFLANYFSSLTWWPSDLIENHQDLKNRFRHEKINNIKNPTEFKSGTTSFPKGNFEYVFTANTLHIMSWKEAKTLFKHLGEHLKETALVFFYGPFNYNGSFTSKSNEEFNQWLKNRDSQSGIRNFEDVKNQMLKNGLKLINDHEMPANNRILVFEKLHPLFAQNS